LNVRTTRYHLDQDSRGRYSSRRDYHPRYGPIPLDTYPAPEVSTQLQVALDGGDPERVAELVAEIDQLVARFDG
jgi:hypothetical protein